MLWLAFIYPQVVHEQRSVAIVANLTQLGITIRGSMLRKFDMDEVKTIFQERRHDSDYEDYCRNQTLSPGLGLVLEADIDTIQRVFTTLPSHQAASIFIPQQASEHAELIKICSEEYRKQELETIVEQLRSATARVETEDDKEFSLQVMQQARKLRLYYSAMRVHGFPDKEAMQLTTDFHRFLLLEETEVFADNNKPESGKEDDENGQSE